MQSEAATVEQDATEPARAARIPRWRLFLRRSHYIVSWKFQGSLILSLLLQTIAFASVLALAMFLPAILAMREAPAGRSELLRAVGDVIAIDGRFWPALIVALVASSLIALHTSHKIAGPLYRFRKVFEALNRGENPGTVRLRGGDHFKDEAEELTRLVAAVVSDRQRLAELERAHADAGSEHEAPC